jgi:hypothetical protein
MTIYLFFQEFSSVLKWGLIFKERRDLTIAGHCPSTGE